MIRKRIPCRDCISLAICKPAFDEHFTYTSVKIMLSSRCEPFYDWWLQFTNARRYEIRISKIMCACFNIKHGKNREYSEDLYEFP